MKKALFALLAAPLFLGANAGTIKMTTEKEIGTAVRILLNAKSATTPISIDWGNGVDVKYTIDPSMPAYNRWIEGTIEGAELTISGNVTEADLAKLSLTAVEIYEMNSLTELSLNDNSISSFQLQSVTPLEYLNLSNNLLVNSTTENRTLTLEYAGETLTSLSLGHNPGLLCLDLRNLVALKYLSAPNCETLGSVFICLPEESRPNLVNIDLRDCDLSHFYPISLPNLTSLILSNNVLMSNDDAPFMLGDYPKLSTLDISGNPGISSLDVTSCKELYDLNISNNRFTAIDLSQAPKLEVFCAANNNIASLDLGNNKELRTLDISNNPIKELDVTMFPNMRNLNISNTQISRVMLMQTPYLEYFRAENSQLEFVDFNGQQAERMRIIDLRNNSQMTAETVDYTIMTLPQGRELYSTTTPNLLLSGSNAETANTGYATSSDMRWICDVVGDNTVTHPVVAVNLVDATDTGENITGVLDRLYPIFGMQFEYDFDLYETSGGKFLISQWQPEYYQKMLSVSNEAIVGVPIHVYPYPEEGKRFKSVTVNGKEITSQWFVVDGEADIKVNFVDTESSISFTTTPGNTLSMLLNTSTANGTVWIDWGTGVRSEYTGMNKYISGYAELSGKRIDGTAAESGKVTIYGDIAALDLEGWGEFGIYMGLWDNQVSSIDLSKAPELKLLNLYYNPISAIDLSNSSELEVLDIGYSAITSIDLSNTPNLMWLDARSDGFGDEDGIKPLSSIDVTKLPILQYLDLKGNEISSIDLSANPYLTWLNLNGNNISSIDLAANPYLNEIDLCGNNLTSIDLSNQTALEELALSRNKLTSLDLSTNTAITELLVDGNELHALDLSALSGLRRVYINDNGMTADELNDIYYLLPQREYGEDDENQNQVKWNLAVIQGSDTKLNDGTRADSSIAIDRGWTPTHLGTNGGSDFAYLDILPTYNGSVKVVDEAGNEYTNGSKAPKYAKLNIIATPNKGYTLESFSLNGEEPIAATSFDMPGIYTKLQVFFKSDSAIDAANADADATEVVASANGVVVTSADAVIDIFTIDGRLLVNAAKVAGSHSFSLDNGVYIVRTTDANGVNSVKVVVK